VADTYCYRKDRH